MENWIGVGIWIIMGALIGLTMKGLIRRPEATEGHTTILILLGGFAAVVGGMLAVGVFSSSEPSALSLAGMSGSFVLSALFSFVYRWGIRGLI